MISLFAMLDDPDPPGRPVLDPGPRWTRRDARNWGAAMRFLRQHPELCEPAEDYRGYFPDREPEGTDRYYDWGR